MGFEGLGKRQDLNWSLRMGIILIGWQRWYSARENGMSKVRGICLPSLGDTEKISLAGEKQRRVGEVSG